MSIKLIGIHGSIGSGKTTLSNILVDKFNYRVASFSRPLKEMVMKLFEIPYECVYGTQEQKAKIIPELNVSGRELLQVIATELFRKNLHDFLPKLSIEKGKLWIWKMEKYLELIEYGNTIGKHNVIGIVIDDIRFKNEIDMIHEKNGIVIYIKRKNNKIESNHESETNLKQYCDFTINNSFSREVLKYSIINILEKI